MAVNYSKYTACSTHWTCHQAMFSALLATCQLLLSQDCVLGPTTCFLFEPGRLTAAWEKDWCIHTHCIIHPVGEYLQRGRQRRLCSLQSVSSVANVKARWSSHSDIAAEATVGDKATNCFFICFVIDFDDWPAHSSVSQLLSSLVDGVCMCVSAGGGLVSPLTGY